MIRYIFSTFIFLLFGIASLFSQPKQNKHNIALWGMGAYSVLLNDADNIDSKGRLGGGLGLGYEWNRKKFVLQSGVEFTRLGGMLSTNPFVLEISDMTDDDVGSIDEIRKYDGNFYFQKNEDVYSLAYVNVPLMFGMQFNKFYFLAGTKFGVNVSGESKVENQVKATGEYAAFIGEFEDMPNHGFLDRKVTKNYEVKMDFNYTASVEFGWKIQPESEKKSSLAYRAGFFFDYGLVNIHKNNYSEASILELPGMAHYWPVMNSSVRSSQMSGKSIHPVFAGVKFTLLFGFRERRDCLCASE